MTHYDLHVKLIAQRTTFSFRVFDVSKTPRILLFNWKRTKKQLLHSKFNFGRDQSINPINQSYLFIWVVYC